MHGRLAVSRCESPDHEIVIFDRHRARDVTLTKSVRHMSSHVAVRPLPDGLMTSPTKNILSPSEMRAP